MLTKSRRYIDLLVGLIGKEFKVSYKRAVFGFFWVILNPILQMVIIGIIFSFFIKIPNYLLFIITGLLAWTFFSQSLSKATPSIVIERSILQKTRFPIETIPISVILSNFLNLLVSSALYLVLLVFFNKLLFPQILLLLPALVWLLIFTIGASLLTASLNVRYRDINFFVQAVLILWFYATPVLYNLSLIPQSLHILFSLNPLTSIFELIHFAVLGQGKINGTIMLVNLVLSLAVLFMGVVVYKKLNKYFVDWL